MKKWGLFLGGVATGVVLTFLFAYIVTLAGGKSSPDGVTNFDQPGQIMNEQSVEVFQVIADNAALVHGKAFYVHLQMFHPKKRIFLCIGSFFARRWHSHAPLPHGAPLAER